MTTPYDLYDVLPGLQVTADEVTAAEQMVVQLLNAAYPTLDLRDGAALRDLLIRPKGAQLALLRKAIQQYDSDRMLVNATDDTSTAVVDGLLSNFFLERNQGEYSRVRVRLRFQASMPLVGISSVYISTSLTFSTDNIHEFSPIEAQTIPVSAMTFDSVAGSYYVDIDCQSTGQGNEYNLKAGSEFLYFSIVNNYFVGATALYLTNESVSPESNTHFIGRAPSAVSTRNLVNLPSIDYVIRNLFNFISYQYSAGYTDYEMMRDYLVVQQSLGAPFSIHRGGMVDIYARSALKVKTVMIPCDLSYGMAVVTGVAPVVFLTPSVFSADNAYTPKESIYGGQADTTDRNRIDISNPTVANLAYLDQNYVNGQPREVQTGFCSLQQVKPTLSFPGSPPALGAAGGYVLVDMLYWDGLDSVQAYLDNKQNRVNNASQICRGFPVVGVSVRFHMSVPNPGASAEASLADAIESALADYYASLNPGATLYPTEILAKALAVGSTAGLTTTFDLQLWLFDGNASQGQAFLQTFSNASNPIGPDDIETLMGRPAETLAINKVKNACVFQNMPHLTDATTGDRLPLLLDSLKPGTFVGDVFPSGVSFQWL